MVKGLPKIKASRGKSRVRASLGVGGCLKTKGLKSYERNLCLEQVFTHFFPLYLTLNSVRTRSLVCFVRFGIPSTHKSVQCSTDDQ